MSSTKKTRIFTTDEAIARLRQAVHSKAANFYSMYSSILGGMSSILADGSAARRSYGASPCLDTATLTHGMLYQLDPHLIDCLFRRAGAHTFFPKNSSDKSFGHRCR
jgi:hypothetical protein